MTKKELKHCIYIDALFVHHVIETVVGLVNWVMQMIGWIFWVPGYLWGVLAGKLKGNYFLTTACISGLSIPVTGTKLWLNNVAKMWTTWDYDE